MTKALTQHILTDGKIEVGELKQFLQSCFRVQYELERANGHTFNVTAEELAERVARSVFSELDEDPATGSITMDQFHEWFEANHGPHTLASIVVAAAVKAPPAVTLDELRRLTGLGDVRNCIGCVWCVLRGIQG